MKLRILNFILPVAVFSILALGSCKDQEEEESFAPDRMFMPAGYVQAASGETEVKLTWNEALYVNPNTTSYTIEVAMDTLFQTPVVYSVSTDTTGVTLTDENLEIKKKYFARVRTNSSENVPASNWLVSSGFRIRGEQIFDPIAPSDLKDKTVLLKWRATPGLTKIVLTPAGGTAMERPVSAAEVTAMQKLVTGLTPNTAYTAEIFAGNKSKGVIAFTTKEPSIFTTIIGPSDDLNATIANAANNDVIGLEPGVYDYTANNIAITGKHVTIQSVSGNPRNTKILFKEITLKGNGAGAKLSGIEFDGTTVADYFINVDAEPAILSSILVENSIVHHTNNAFIRANRAAANAQKIDFIKVNNTIAYANGTGSYHYFMLDKLEFKRLEITNSTMYDIARALISWATNMTVATRPVILIDKTTINNFGFQDRNNIILDANANAVAFTLQNSIIANTPKPGQAIGTSALRANTTGSEIVVRNNNFFNFNGGNPLVPLVFPSYVQLSNNKTIDLGWTAATSTFALPANSELRTAGTANGPIGDPRWY